MQFGAVIVGGGSGSRLGSDLPKAFVSLGGKPLYQYSLETFASYPRMREVIFVSPEAFCAKICHDGVTVVGGGVTRQDSVWNGLCALSDAIDVVLIHDAARPFISARVIDRLLAAVGEGVGAIAALPLNDTVKLSRGDSVLETLDRSCLWVAQTPQAFPVPLLKEAYARATAEKWEVTDEASMAERLGATVRLIPGDSRNFKITTPDDLALAETLLKGL